ncbi:unnamed protein product, partial [Closterium sp. NIES-53]
MQNDQHVCEADRCLAFLADTPDAGLKFGDKPESLHLVGYADTNDASDKQNRSSTNSYDFVFGGAAVSWTIQCIKCMTLSSMEPEYIAATKADKVARRLHFLLAVFELFNTGMPTVFNVDNQSAIAAAKGLGLKGNLKHMERHYIWLQQMVKREKIGLQYAPTIEQPADFITKTLHFSAFNMCSVALGQVHLADV